MPLEARCWIEMASSMLAEKSGKNVKVPQGGGREHELSIFLMIWKNRPVFPCLPGTLLPNQPFDMDLQVPKVEVGTELNY